MPKKSKNPADPTKQTSTPSPPVDDPRRAASRLGGQRHRESAAARREEREHVPTFDEFERSERQRARRGY